MIRLLKRGDERNDGTSEARGLDISPGFAIPAQPAFSHTGTDGRPRSARARSVSSWISSVLARA